MHVTNLANELSKKGYPSTILVTRKIAEDVFFETKKNVNIVLLNKYISEHSNDLIVKKHIKRRKFKIRIFKYFRYISKFFPELDKKLNYEIKMLRKSEALSAFMINNPDCIYVPFGLGYFETAYFAICAKSNIVYSERTTPVVEFPKTEFEKKQIIKTFKKADHIILQTKNSFDFYKSLGIDATVINNPIKANLPDAYNGERRKCIVNFCRISEEKNLPLLFDAFMEFHKNHTDYKLEIYGNAVNEDEENLREFYKNKISEINATEYISIYPARSDIHNAVRDCAMFVSSSDFEGLSNSMIEAMAIGLPCICTDCIGGGAREVIKNEENGLLVPIKDSKALSKAMCQMADNKELAKRCSENAQKIRIDLSVNKISDKWIKVIEQIQ